MLRSIPSSLTALALTAFLTGCGAASGTRASRSSLPPPPDRVLMLSEDEGPHPLPLGYVVIQREAGPDRSAPPGTVYLVEDRDGRILGHVTPKGHAVRYRKGDDIGESLGTRNPRDQIAAILGAKKPLRSFDLQGRPQAIP